MDNKIRWIECETNEKSFRSTAEHEAYKTLEKEFATIGFEIQHEDYSKLNKIHPDFIIKSRCSKPYTIGIEFKSGIFRYDRIESGLEKLQAVKDIQPYDKLLLVLGEYNSSDRVKKQEYSKRCPTDIEILSLNEISNWIKTMNSSVEENYIEKKVFVFIQSFVTRLIDCIPEDPEVMRQMEWFHMEEMLAELFRGLGFEVTLTRPSKDGGKDIILNCIIDSAEFSFLVEVKHWKNSTKVGKNHVRKFTSVVIKENRQKGLFLSTYGFTNNYYEALTEKEMQVVNFGDGDKIIELCKKYRKINEGIWLPDDLKVTLFENTISLK